ncbi:hypothetical protein JCM10449v2_007064 [Rhodotorula kratochvilovae]
MSTPRSPFAPGGDVSLLTSTPPTAPTGVRIKLARTRTGGDPPLGAPTSRSPPDDTVMGSPASPPVAIMLPTPPASLSTSYIAQPLFAPLDSGSAEHATSGEPAQDAQGRDADPASAEGPRMDDRRGTTPPFALDEGNEGEGVGAVAMDFEGPYGSELDFGDGPRAPLALMDSPFSAAAPIPRPFRSRYASSSTDSLALDFSVQDPLGIELDIDAVMPHKRSHSHVSPSTGHTPPASFDAGSSAALVRPTSLFSPPVTREEPRAATSPRWRESFSYDSQRAEPTTSTSVVSALAPAPLAAAAAASSTTSFLRRRARAPTESDPTPASSASLAVPALNPRSGDRGSSKRRRSGTLSLSDVPSNSPPAGTSTGSSRLPPWLASRAAGGSSSALPVLSRAMSTSTDDDVRTIRRRGRLSLGCFPGADTGEDVSPERALSPLDSSASLSRVATSSASSLFPPAPPQQAYAALLTHAHRSDALAARGEGLLRAAVGVLARAEAEVGRAAALVDERERERERDVRARMPSTEGLADPRDAAAAAATARPVVGVRLGEGWSPPASSPPPPPPPQPRRRRSSLWSLSSPLSSPPPASSGAGEPHSPQLAGSGASTSSSSSSSASSRARTFLTQLRARRPRLARNATAVSPPEAEAEAPASLRSWTHPSPSPPPPLAGSAFDEQAEQAAAERLNRRLMERRRVSESIEHGAGVGEGARMETALWGEMGASDAGGGGRRLRGPTQAANERWRFGTSTATSVGEPYAPTAAGTALPATTATTTATATPHLQSHTRPSWRRFARSAGLEAPDGTAAGDAHFADRARDDSPSPRRGRFASPAAALRAADEGAAPAQRGIGRPAIRLSRPGAAAAEEGRSSSRPRLLFDDDDDDDGADEVWPAQPPPPGALMLPSGSDGARILFPHPAAAAGPADAREGESGRSASPFGTYGPDHLFAPQVRLRLPLSRTRKGGLTALSRTQSDPSREELPFSARRAMPWDELPPSAFASRRLAGSRFDPFGDTPSTATTATNARAVHHSIARNPAPRRSSLADALAHFGTRTEPPDARSSEASLRRRRAPYGETDEAPIFRRSQELDGPAARENRLRLELDPHRRDPYTAPPAPIDPYHRDVRVVPRPVPPEREAQAGVGAYRRSEETVDERLAQHRQSRMERLQALRRERHVMRSLLGGAPAAAGSPPVTESDAPAPAPPPAPRSPGRGIGLGEFLRGLGAGARYGLGGRGALGGRWDDEFHAFWGRDSAALDPRNYLVRSSLLHDCDRVC